jgi:hypothetical protein
VYYLDYLQIYLILFWIIFTVLLLDLLVSFKCFKNFVLFLGEAEHRTLVLADGSVVSLAPWSHTVSTDTVPYTVVSDIDPVLGESFPVPAKQKTEIEGDLVNRFEWRYFLRRAQGGGKSGGDRGGGKPVVQVGRRLRVNGENLLTTEYDRETGTVAVFKDDHVTELLNVTYDGTARPVRWGPR